MKEKTRYILEIFFYERLFFRSICISQTMTNQGESVNEFSKIISKYSFINKRIFIPDRINNIFYNLKPFLHGILFYNFFFNAYLQYITVKIEDSEKNIKCRIFI
ncbi:hypothetical protein EDEG_03132 [Edhazardia aedis USNM 41457]|uniref:Uncharacterized protein n=1 Tax=Edhazardia aedis (strain USNM 41457) TaxID=1003232 RepID=J9D4H6_EDHAE|nr:hypothetical protein EDEG_03132 [Edhazardia aedis USNM 41457]|eukprot:EJW02459.1 hypothetical protein EDEG_03132 [Edhazardia aedis USNM 41457]